MIKRNPITSFFGIVMGVCGLASYFIPGSEAICQVIDQVAIAGGFMAAADGR